MWQRRTPQEEKPTAGALEQIKHRVRHIVGGTFDQRARAFQGVVEVQGDDGIVLNNEDAGAFEAHEPAPEP